jgi:hypothetical protein
MTKTSPREWLELIAEKAEDLRRAGVVRVKLAGCEVEIAPAIEPLRVTDAGLTAAEPVDALNDPASFVGGRVPRFHKRGDQA